MKKILSLLFLLLFSTIVSAKQNVLYFVEQDNKIVYENGVNQNVFMEHLDMLPGGKYSDELIIQNGTQTKYKLYLKIQPLEKNKTKDELLNSITMKLYLDNNLIYDGMAKGLDYSKKGINLQNSVLLREFNPSSSSTLRVETSLLPEYSNINNDEISKINWIFYAQYGDEEPIEIIPVPITDKYQFPMWVFSLIIVLIGVCMIIYTKKQEKKNKK